MRRNDLRIALAAALLAGAWPSLAGAQSVSGESLMGLGRSELRNELGTRYDAALALTQDAGVIAVDTTRFNWASQAKAQCGIALGFLKSGTKDPVSVGKCVDAYDRMQLVSASAPVPVSVAAAVTCTRPVPVNIFFDWNGTVPSQDAAQALNEIVHTTQTCKWSGLTVTGHTDRSGGDQYNNALSLGRAKAVASMLEAAGVAGAILTVSGRGEAEPKEQTLDGERNPANRRVEVTVQ
jgi:outer membrane protein OmpA-like peptidoglycan-associated protein